MAGTTISALPKGEKLSDTSFGYGEDMYSRFRKAARPGEGRVRDQLSRFSRLADMFGEDASKSYLDTTEGKSFSNQIERSSQRSKRDLSNYGANMSDEAKIASLGKISEAEGSAFANLVSGADRRRQGLRSQQMAALSQVLGGEQGLAAGRQSMFAQSYGMGANLAQSEAQLEQMRREAQARGDQNMLNLLGQLGSAAIPLFGNSSGSTGGAS